MSDSVRNFLYGACPRLLKPYWERVMASEVSARLIRGTFWSLAGAVISRGLMLASFILVARLLGQTGYGEFGMIRSTVNMFVVFAGVGLGMTATKHVAEYYKHDPERAGRILAMSGIFAFAAGIVVSTVVFLFAPWLAANTINAPHLAPEIRIGAVILLVNGLNGAQTGALAGFEAFQVIAKVNLWVGLSSFPLLVGGAYLGGVRGAVWALLLNMAVNWLLNHLALRKVAARNKVPFDLHGCLREMPILWQFSLPAALSGFMVSPVFWTCNAFLVNQPGGYDQMGIFDAANQWRMAVLFVPGMVGQVVLPVLSNLHGTGNGSGYRKVFKYNIILNGGMGLMAAIIISMAGPLIMRSYGRGFEEGYLVLVLLVFSAVLVAISQVIGQVIASRGRMWAGFFINTLWGGTLLGSSSWFILRGYGALGLASAYIVAYSLHIIWVSIYVWQFFRRKASSL